MPTSENAVHDGPDLERAITLTDAVVAIAMTLLVLPLVEVAGEVDTGHLRTFLSEQGDLLLSFVISFLVIHVFWATHGAAFDRMRRPVSIRRRESSGG